MNHNMYKFFIFFSILFIRCGIQERNDIYNVVPIGSPLTLSFLENTSQIIRTDSCVILMYDLVVEIEDIPEGVSHVLFYDNNLRLKYASYLNSRFVDLASNKIAYAHPMEEKYENASRFRQNRSKEFSIVYQNSFRHSGNNLNKIYNKIIQSISIDSTSVILLVRTNKDLLSGFGFKNIKEHLDAFPDLQTIRVPFKNFKINHENDMVYTDSIDLINKKLIRDQMAVQNHKILKQFYSEIWKQLNAEIN